ncbi:AMP-binding protein [Candidatus Reidiella endopervernicosa]|uniref:AMP-binding protein n=1 Tax=Candidatus Reidiella endopervernicosa TaxID=2738883 RepID=UPI003B969CE3
MIFTSGSEGVPKGVVLSHLNLLANYQQMRASVPFNPTDSIINVLPIFHSFGLTAATILPLLSGIKCFLYPSPLHYRIIPEIAYEIGATVIFGTNTFLAGYAKHAHPYDFHKLRYVFAGAEKVHEQTRKVWMDEFGHRILDGYGASETSPVLSFNTPMACKLGSVGQLMPAIDYRLEPVEGVAEGGRLHVRGPNVMSGYLLHDNPGVLVPPQSSMGAGWYDTGDIVTVDDEGFVTIQGRAKRFAKIGGEMVSLAAVEELVNRVWPDALHAVVSVADAQKGEQLVLITEQKQAPRAELLAFARSTGVSELTVPRKIITGSSVPLLGTGKIDYPAAQRIADAAQ